MLKYIYTLKKMKKKKVGKVEKSEVLKKRI